MGKYIDKIEFHNLLKDYRDLGVEIIEMEELEIDGTDIDKDDLSRLKSKRKRIYDKIGQRFLMIAKNYLNKPSFINYSPDWKDDMVSEAVYDMVRYIDNYDIDLMEQYLEEGKTPDPFAYFTRYVPNGAVRLLKERNKDKEVIVRIPFIENIDKRDVSYE